VSDFGIAKLLEQSVLTSAQTPVGTPMYMAPEQYQGYPCFASDQYSLAVMVYEWICGVRPFQGPAIGLALQHMSTLPPRPRDHAPQLSEAVERVIFKALAKAPEDRYARIEEMACALREAAQAEIALSLPIEAKGTVPLVSHETFINSLSSLPIIPIQGHSLLLSYSHHNHVFIKRLYKDLKDHHVHCWFAPHDLPPGTPLMHDIEGAIHLHEKLLLILSDHTVNSTWVELEVEAALYKEVTTGEAILFPIRLDNTVLQSDTQWAKRLRQRHIGDFTNFQDDAAYQQAFATLLRHLKVSKSPTA
jgi:serine/threonine protein kinase